MANGVKRSSEVAQTPLRLYPGVQHYHWGRPASVSLVAALAGAAAPDNEPDTKFAELWLGAHPGLPSQLEADGARRGLDVVVAQHPDSALGSSVRRRFGDTLPFLFKVLSIGQPLSLQAHPDKALAVRLHREKGYPDENHKPEMAVALSPCSLLFGFRGFSEIAVELRRLPELRACAGEALCETLLQKGDEAEGLRILYRALLTSSLETRRRQGALLLERLAGAPARSVHDEWALQFLRGEFGPDDAGIFSLYMMNIVQLEPGQGVYIPTNTVHAYLEGELAECMANSDNVVRAGLTPKAKDLETLLGMLRYVSGPPALLAPAEAAGRRSYRVHDPGLEFGIDALQAGCRLEYGSRSPFIILCVSGRGSLEAGSRRAEFRSGEAYFVPAAAVPFAVTVHQGMCLVALVPDEE